MIEEVLRYLKNFFPGYSWHSDKWEIKNKSITIDGFERGKYFYIEGSRFNDGVHVYGTDELENETFDGLITELCIPKQIVELATEIKTWQTANSEKLQNIYQSESFEGYSYSRTSGKDGNIIGWQNVFASRLKPWRKI